MIDHTERRHDMMMHTLLVALAAIIALLAPQAAEAKAPVSSWCQDHKDGRHTAADHKDAAANTACQICVYQADHDLPELGNTNNETCVHIRDEIVVRRLVKDGELVQCNPATVGVAACELTQRCFEAGLTPGSGGIAFSSPKPLTPEEQAKVIVAHQATLETEAERAAVAAVQHEADLAGGGLFLTPPAEDKEDKDFCSSTGCKVGLILGGVALAATVGIIGWQAGWFATEETLTVNLGASSSALLANGVPGAIGF